jgi:hypothetical protein
MLTHPNGRFAKVILTHRHCPTRGTRGDFPLTTLYSTFRFFSIGHWLEERQVSGQYSSCELSRGCQVYLQGEYWSGATGTEVSFCGEEFDEIARHRRLRGAQTRCRDRWRLNRRVVLTNGDREKAQTLLTDALEIYTHIGMPRHIEMTQTLLARAASR